MLERKLLNVARGKSLVNINVRIRQAISKSHENGYWQIDSVRGDAKYDAGNERDSVKIMQLIPTSDGRGRLGHIKPYKLPRNIEITGVAGKKTRSSWLTRLYQPVKC